MHNWSSGSVGGSSGFEGRTKASHPNEKDLRIDEVCGSDIKAGLTSDTLVLWEVPLCEAAFWLDAVVKKRKQGTDRGF